MIHRDSIQSQLDHFYQTALAEARPHFSEDDLAKLSAPFLIAVSEEYLEAPVRIMFVGKETNGWWGKLDKFYGSPDAINQISNRYKKQMAMKRWRGRFFQTLARVSKALDMDGHKAIVWNNLMKMDWYRGRSDSRTSINHSQLLFDLSSRLFRFEVELLKPDVIIFASGADYDKAIKTNLVGYETEEVIQKRGLWKFKFNEIICYRARHPGAVRKDPFWPTADYYSYIIDDVKKEFSHVYNDSPSQQVPDSHNEVSS